MNRLLQSKWFTMFACISLLVLGIVLFLRKPELDAISRESKRADEKILEIQREQDDLKERQKYLASEAYLEQQARLKLGYKKQEEKVVYIYRTASQQQEPTTEKPITNLKLWWYYLI